jgi:prevent-host-death family protein
VEDVMEISAKEFRGKPGQIIEQASRGTEVVITIRGKKMARLIPYQNDKNNKIDDEIFGLWKNRDENISVENLVRSARKRRSF